MKKLFKAITAVTLVLSALSASVTARAYNVVNLPESMTFADALEIFNASDITSITVSDIANGNFTTLGRDDIDTFYNTVKDLTVYRTTNPTPFRGIAVNIFSNDDTKTYCINSGMQIGKFGNGNYICYKLNDFDTEKILYLDSMYWDDQAKTGGDTFYRSTARDFLKMPDVSWSRTYVAEAAEKNLLPYEFTASYTDNITREQFCKLLGNFIAVKENYKSLEAYMSDNGGAYLRNYFEDCTGADNSINILYAMGIVTGKDDTHFDPRGIITREQAAALLTRVAEKYRYITTTAPLSYSDSWSVSDWAKVYVAWVSENGIMTGLSDTEFAPQSTYTVEQAIATIVRLYDFLE